MQYQSRQESCPGCTCRVLIQDCDGKGWVLLCPPSRSLGRGTVPVEGCCLGTRVATSCHLPADSEQPTGFAKSCQGWAVGSKEKLALFLLAFPILHRVPVARLKEVMQAGCIFKGGFPRAEPHSNIAQVAAVQAVGERAGLELTHVPETPFPNF